MQRAVCWLTDMSTALRFASHFVVSDRVLPSGKSAPRGEPSAADDASVDLRELGRLVQRDGPVSAGRAVRIVRRAAQAMGEAHASGRHADVRNHVHSLGVALFFVLTGRAPFATTSGWPPVARLSDSPPSPSDYSPYPVPAALDAVVRMCLAKRPSDRFGSMQELSAALGAINYAESEETLPESGPRLSQRAPAPQRPTLRPTLAVVSRMHRARTDSMPPSMGV